jgi:hypothetical protein
MGSQNHTKVYGAQFRNGSFTTSAHFSDVRFYSESDRLADCAEMVAKGQIRKSQARSNRLEIEQRLQDFSVESGCAAWKKI